MIYQRTYYLQISSWRKTVYGGHCSLGYIIISLFFVRHMWYSHLSNLRKKLKVKILQVLYFAFWYLKILSSNFYAIINQFDPTSFLWLCNSFYMIRCISIDCIWCFPNRLVPLSVTILNSDCWKIIHSSSSF